MTHHSRHNESVTIVNLVSLLAAGFVLASQVGCASVSALNMPGPANDEAVDLGMSRIQVEDSLRVGATSQFDNSSDDTTNVRYEYQDGPPQATKLRALVYVAGDVFTLFISELIFWPIELYAKERIERVGMARYSDQNELIDWTIQRRGGETLAHEAVGEDLVEISLNEPTELAGPMDELVGLPEE